MDLRDGSSRHKILIAPAVNSGFTPCAGVQRERSSNLLRWDGGGAP